MFNPFFDPSNMTDRELNEKIVSQSERVAIARASGISSDIVSHMYAVVIACEDELSLRYAKKEAIALKEDDSCIYDTEKYVTDNSEERGKNDSKRKQKYKPGW